ncbi:S-methyl-5'-thioinosine phosphorylase [Arthrobacter sp. NA-172]|uniref:S-methyl-5'-thioinosine phosphorylase n=1 Tax=Arthrobacter sp. NA-172 TaxID=3367524 RepID=UPI003754DA89
MSGHSMAAGGLHARIGVIGGSGTYRLPGAEILGQTVVDTPYGSPSGPLTLARISGRPVVFLPRHGTTHSVPPHRINYRANLWALKSLGVEAVLSSSAVGGLREGFPPGTFVVTDQFIDRTWGRADTFYDGDSSPGAAVQHLPAAEPFCPRLRAILQRALAAKGLVYAPAGTVVVINGPRFSTRAESAWYSAVGADIISMTQYPEPVLAAELNMGFANLAYITDSDTGHDGTAPVTAVAVFERLKRAQTGILSVLEETIASIGESYRPDQPMPQSAVDAVMGQPVNHGKDSGA